MSKKLVYVNEVPFWITPEGRLEAVELHNGRVVERIMLRTSRGLQVLRSTASIQEQHADLEGHHCFFKNTRRQTSDLEVCRLY